MNSRKVFGRDIHHVMLLHLGSFSSHILPDLFKVLDEEGFDIVTLEEAQKDTAYDYDPDFADPRSGTLVEQGMQAKQIRLAGERDRSSPRSGSLLSVSSGVSSRGQ